MKRNFYCLSIAVFSIFSYSPCFAHSPQIVYGLEQAKHFNSPTKNRDVYIQIASFTKPSNATRYQNILKSKTKLDVNISHKEKTYAVLIGPLRSSSEIRSAAIHLLGSSKEPVIKTPPPHVIAPVIHAEKPPQIVAPMSTNHPPMPSSAHWFVSAGSAEQFPLSSDNMRVNNNSGFPEPYNQDTYSLNHSNGAVVALSAGRRWERDYQWLPAYSVGIAWQHFFNSRMNGTVMQYSDPAFLNYDYSWNVQSDMLLASAKLNLVQYQKLSPYINGGIGGAFNQTSGYSETPLAGVTPRDTPGFTNNSSNQFAYQVGAGLDLQASKNVIFSLGYNYQNVGNLSSGPGVGTWANQSLGSGSFGSREVLAQVNYLFGK